MQIDYYCFPTQTGDLSPYMDIEQYTNYDQKIHYQTAQEDILCAIKLGKLLLFDMRKHSFIDENGKIIDISGKAIFPRSTIQESIILLESIEKADGKSIMASKDYAIIENWFDKVKTKREIKISTLEEIEEHIEDYEKNYGNKLFIKTVQKLFSGVCIIMNIEFAGKSRVLFDSHFHSLNMTITDSKMPILICKALDVVKDEYGRREWRAFVVDNELWCLSRCSDDVVPIEAYIEDKVKSEIMRFKGILPSSYVVDFFEYTDENDEIIFDVCEFNPIVASGVYQNNDLVF